MRNMSFNEMLLKLYIGANGLRKHLPNTIKKRP